MLLYLIRHAQSLNNSLPEEQRVEDPPLTELGHEQARRLARVVKKLELTELVTSPFLRTLQTTEHLRQATGLAPHVRTHLHERGGCVSGHSAIGLSGRPGMSREQIVAQFATYVVSPEIDGAGWWRSQPEETLEAAQLRAQALLARTIEEYAATDARVAYVMHADIKLILLGLLHRETLDVPWNTSISRLWITRDHVRLEEYNSVAHLSPELVTL
jgi:2,3-bisphosphoglycerate-dependent phosphoglycerate mutase